MTLWCVADIADKKKYEKPGLWTHAEAYIGHGGVELQNSQKAYYVKNSEPIRERVESHH